MLLEEKYFLQDKNYLLKTVQAFVKEKLVQDWLNEVFVAYNRLHNPMKLEDDFIIELRLRIKDGTSLLEEPYDLLSAIYRHKHGDNQLKFQWDGRTHMEMYDEQWRKVYKEWIQHFSLRKEIQRPIIKFVTSGKGTNVDFLRSSIRRDILSTFKFKMRSHTLYRASA